MKIGIFTFPNSISYGAALQMYALYRSVQKLGYETEVINYHNIYMKNEKHTKNLTSPSFKFVLKTFVRKIVHQKKYHGFKAFEKKRIKLYPYNPVTNKSDLLHIGNRYDAIICGSDQVWNPYITNEDLSYFLDFCGEKTRRISYAPSFGVDEISEGFSDKISKELNKFHSISVREASGRNLIKRFVDKEIELVLDPTFLLSKNEWESLESPFCKIKDEYVLYYVVKNSPKLFSFCRNFAKKNGLNMIVVDGNILYKIRNKDPFIKYAIDVTPSEWLNLVHNAKYVVTNSFHGTAFSIIYRKDFYLEMPSIANSRLVHILEFLGLQNRVLNQFDLIEASSVDYFNVEKKLSELIDSSVNYLKSSLKED